MGNGDYIDVNNNVKSMNLTHVAIGQKIGLKIASDPTAILSTHEMIELPKEEEE